MHLLRTLTLALLALAGAQEPAKGPVKELYDSGKVKAQYQLDEKGLKDGQYQEFYENGKRKVVATYVHGTLERVYEEFHENGKPRVKKRYLKGKIDGDLFRFDDKGQALHRVTFRKGEVFLYPDFVAPVPAHPRAPELIRRRLDELDPPAQNGKWPLAERYAETPVLTAPHKAGRLKKEYLEWALRHVRAYRFLSELSPDIELNEAYNDLAQHGAGVLALNGDLSHSPPKPPGLADDFFKKGFEGCAKSNLSLHPGGSLRDSVDNFMDDSDPSNIERVGHRCWILNAPLGKIGFGEAGKEGTFKALYVVDSSAGAGPRSGKPAPKDAAKGPGFVAYPSRGYYPADYLASGAAWSFHPQEGGAFPLNSKDDARLELWRLNEEYDLAEKVEINHLSLSSFKALVFRPVLPKGDLAGARFLVSIASVSKPGARVSYLVEFIRRAAP